MVEETTYRSAFIWALVEVLECYGGCSAFGGFTDQHCVIGNYPRL
jgi:hypothetical protein